MTDIDLVIPMVFPQDPEWQQEYELHKGLSAKTVKHVRYRSWGTEDLLVRCCMKYMPWLRTIHILLAGESQAGYLNARSIPKVRTVFHREFMPVEVLPCFSSPCIEMFLHRIPGLSECFIYSNDDVFPLSPLKPEDFFRPSGTGTGMLPCQHIIDRKYPDGPNLFQRKCMYQQNMVAAPFGRHFTRTYPDTGHVFAPILKSSCEEVWRRHGDEIRRFLSPLKRTDRSFNHYIYQLYQQYAGLYVDHKVARHYTDHGTKTARIVEIIRDRQAGVLCLNDNERIEDWRMRAKVVRDEISAKLLCP